LRENLYGAVKVHSDQRYVTKDRVLSLGWAPTSFSPQGLECSGAHTVRFSFHSFSPRG